MVNITIRDLTPDETRRLRDRAEINGRSMDDEVRAILRDVLAYDPKSENLAERIRAHFVPLGGVDLELPSRHGPDREPPIFD